MFTVFKTLTYGHQSSSHGIPICRYCLGGISVQKYYILMIKQSERAKISKNMSTFAEK